LTLPPGSIFTVPFGLNGRTGGRVRGKLALFGGSGNVLLVIFPAAPFGAGGGGRLIDPTIETRPLLSALGVVEPIREGSVPLLATPAPPARIFERGGGGHRVLKVLPRVLYAHSKCSSPHRSPTSTVYFPTATTRTPA